MAGIKEETKPCRLWSMATKTCLVLTVKDNKVESVTLRSDERDNPGESSIVKITEADAGPDEISYMIVFTLNNKEYALHVDNNTVTALEVPVQNATRFVPRDSFKFQPFVEWEVASGPSQTKYIAVDKEGRLSVQECQHDSTHCRHSTTFVKIEVTAREEK